MTFSDDDDDLDLGIDDDPPAKAKSAAASDNKAGSSIMGSLFGKSDSVEKHLQRPGTGGSQTDYKFGSKPATPGKVTIILLAKIIKAQASVMS